MGMTTILKRNILMINGYSDDNKGDSGIVIATIEKIYEHINMNDVNVHLNSLFSVEDPHFTTHNRFVSSHVSSITTSLFPSYRSINPFKRFVRIFISLCRSFLMLWRPQNSTLHRQLNNDEKKAIELFGASDIVISKGGSFLYDNQDSFRTILTFYRMAFPILLAIRMGKTPILLGQSIGPAHFKISRILLSYIFNNSHVLLREKVCYTRYISGWYSKELETMPDVAFSLKYSYVKEFEKYLGYCGITLLTKYYFKSKKAYINYLKKMKEVVEWLAKGDIEILLIPQVVYPGANDTDSINDLFTHCNTNTRKKLTIIKNDYSPKQLKYLYSKLEFLLAARLHSAIFALSECVPSVNLSYQGTKSKGILNNIAMGEYCLDINTSSSGQIISKIKDVITNRRDLVLMLKSMNSMVNDSIDKKISSILS
jgi:colanic acid/amylovoran biosynthesis protein